MKFEKVLISIGLIFYIIIASMLGIYSYKLLLVFFWYKYFNIFNN